MQTLPTASVAFGHPCRGFLRLIFGACALAIAACGQGGPTEGSASGRAAIVSGSPSQADPAVVAIVTRRLSCGPAPAAAFCTGALIAPRVVLTAAHCVSDRRPGEIRIYLGDDPAHSVAFADVVATNTHPRFDPSTGDFDVALALLAAPADAPPLPLAAAVPAASIVDATVRLVGFGVDSAGASGVKRTGAARVSSLEGNFIRYVPSPAMSCGGDSGGPVLYDDGSGERIVAVTRSGDSACAAFGTALLVGAVTADFIEPFVARAASAPAPAVLDTTRDFCAATCATDADCPLEMMCLSERAAGLHCGFPSLQSGRFGAVCTGEGDCSGNACVAVVTGGVDTCRCFAPCAEPAPPGVRASGGACDTSGRGGQGGCVWLVLLALVGFRTRVKLST